MNAAIERLIPATVSHVNEHGGYMTKTKLLKLLYLFDVEYYRIHRQTFSGFQWKYFHLGPWTKEFEAVLDRLIAQDVLTEVPSSKPDYDTKFLKAIEADHIGRLFPSYRDEAALKTVLDTWGNCTTAEILDYVYFRTEPMEYGVRNEPLDFTKISAQPTSVYTRLPSGKTPGEIKALRREFQEAIRKVSQQAKEAAEFTPPNYDAEFFEALEKLDAANR
jgi:hypothetical protein